MRGNHVRCVNFGFHYVSEEIEQDFHPFPRRKHLGYDSLKASKCALRDPYRVANLGLRIENNDLTLSARSSTSVPSESAARLGVGLRIFSE
jgi:hypothetical protein